MNKDKTNYLTVKDHSVSGETFQLLYNEELDMLETFPQPTEDKLSEYYKTEDYISHTDTQRNLFEKVYHWVRDVSLDRKLKLINSFPVQQVRDKNFKERKLLDIGCGTGDFLKKAKDNDWIVSGIEPNEKARKIANSKTNNSVLKTEHLLKFETNSFDVITLWHVFEHLPNIEEYIQIIRKLLKDTGVLIIAVPNYKSYDAKFYKSFWAAYDPPRHLWHFSRTSISSLLEKFNFRLEKMLPMKFDAFYVSLLSEKYKTGWMNIFRAFLIGLTSNLKAMSSKEHSSIIYILKNK